MFRPTTQRFKPHSGPQLGLSKYEARAPGTLKPCTQPGLGWAFLGWLGPALGFKPKLAHHYSVDTTKMGFLGMIIHWIEVKGKEWKMRLEVIGFKALSSALTGENLGRYAVRLLDCVGIMDKKRSKVRQVLTLCHYNLTPV